MKQKSKIQVIGVTGNLTAGKDTFFSLLDKICPEQFTRAAFADGLKLELDAFVKKSFGFSLFNFSAAQKALIRPVLIGWGMSRRNQDKDYWISNLLNHLDHMGNLRTIVICDVRYENEVLALRKKYGHGFKLVKISRPDAKVEIPQEEQINQPLVDKYLDYTVIWPTVGIDQLDKLTPAVRDCIECLKNS